MASPGVSGSVIGNIAAQRKRVQRARQLLGLSDKGIPKPQQGPPPKAPKDPRPPQTVPEAPAPEQFQSPEAEQARQEMLKKVQAFLQQVQTGGAAPVQESPIQPVNTEAAAAQPILPQLEQFSRPHEPLSLQFARIAGRSPTPRELAVFSARIELERQLGRPPTASELKQYIMRPEAASPSFPVAFESAGESNA